MKSLASVVVGLVSACGLAGCSDAYEATLTGTVTRGGKPVASALMNFHSQAAGPMAYAMTEEDGTYAVLTGSRPGLIPGEYLVAFGAVPEDPLPEKYQSIQTSGLEYDVKPGKNTFDIRLE